MPELKVGIIGASRVATYAMVSPIKVVADVCVTAIAARDLSRALAFADQHGIARAYDKYASVLADPEVDLVYISTPPNTHAQLAMDAIAAGKHVLVEKPFAMTVEEARWVHAAGLAAGVQVFEAMHSPHHNLFQRVLEIIKAGEIGVVKKLTASFDAPIEKNDPFRWDVDMGGGALFRTALSDPLAINGGMNWYRANMPPISKITDATYWPTDQMPIRVPVLLVWGEADRTFVPEFMNEIKQYALESEIFRLPGINHWTSMEQPQAANSAIERFLLQHIGSNRR